MAMDPNNLDSMFNHIYTDELPSFIDSLKSMEHLPNSLLDTISTVEKNIEHNKTLIAPLLTGGIAETILPTDIVGGIGGGLFGKLHKKEQMKKLSGKRLIAIQDNATHFNDTIYRMEQLLGKNKNGKPDYENLTPEEQQELLSLAEEMKQLSEELTEQLAA